VDMGLDSVLGVEWIQSLNKQYACNLTTTVVYEYPTIHKLARFLEKEGLKQSPDRLPIKVSSGPEQDLVPTEQADPVRMPGAQSTQTVALGADPAPEEHLQTEGAIVVGHEQAQVLVSTNLSSSLERKEAIAVVGVSGKYPAARNLNEYWDNLV